MPRPSACRISVAAAICTATEMRCMTKGTNLRVAHVASRSNSACVSRLARCSAALRISPSVLRAEHVGSTSAYMYMYMYM